MGDDASHVGSNLIARLHATLNACLIYPHLWPTIRLKQTLLGRGGALGPSPLCALPVDTREWKPLWDNLGYGLVVDGYRLTFLARADDTWSIAKTWPRNWKPWCPICEKLLCAVPVWNVDSDATARPGCAGVARSGGLAEPHSHEEVCQPGNGFAFWGPCVGGDDLEYADVLRQAISLAQQGTPTSESAGSAPQRLPCVDVVSRYEELGASPIATGPQGPAATHDPAPPSGRTHCCARRSGPFSPKRAMRHISA